MRLLALKTLSSILFLGLMAYSLAGFADHTPAPASSSNSMASWYASVRLGIAFKPSWRADDVVETVLGVPSATNLTFKYGNSFNYGGAIGYMQDRLAMELEVSHRYANLKRFATTTEGVYSINGGRLSITPVMVNTYYHFLSMLQGHMSLYAGVGMGIAYVSNNINTSVTIPALTTTRSFTQKRYVNTFAYQLILGMSYQFNHCFGMGLEDRYFSALFDHVWTFNGNDTFIGNPTSISFRSRQFHNNIVNVTFNYYFS